MVTLKDLALYRQELRKDIPRANPCQLKKVFFLPVTNIIAIHAQFDRLTDKPSRHATERQRLLKLSTDDPSLQDSITHHFRHVQSNAPHLTLLVFKDIDVENEKSPKMPIGFEVLPGRRLYTTRPSFSKTNVNVCCTCSDYFFTWWKWNREIDAFAGVNMQKYQRITDPPPKGRPYKNPAHKPGVCKHILSTVNKLSSTQWLAT